MGLAPPCLPTCLPARWPAGLPVCLLVIARQGRQRTRRLRRVAPSPCPVKPARHWLGWLRKPSTSPSPTHCICSPAPPRSALLSAPPFRHAGATAHDTQRPWLADVLMALLQRAAELDLLPATVPAEDAEVAAASWRAQLPRLYELVERHVSALHEAFQAGMALGQKDTAAEAKALMPISLVRVLVPHCTKEQAGALRGMLRDLGV